ncbi:MAG TPA: hemolysin family protein [Acidimicrobiales bacterium]|nr:hemolysin family protein [Acidimicrobiales bacterium]
MSPAGGPLLVAVTVTASDMWLLVAVGVLLVLAALLVLAESALDRVTRPRAEDLADEGRGGAAALVALVSRPERYVPTVVFLRVTCVVVQATLVGIVARSLFGAVGMVLATVLDVVVVFVAVETAPKTWAVLDPERAALSAARPVRRLVQLPPLRLVAAALIGLTNVVLPGKGLKHGPYVSSEEELLAVAELGVEEGVIEEDERALIESIIEFGDTIVREVMVPRPDMVTVNRRFRVTDVMEVMLLNGYSRLPVCGDRLDDVSGLAYAKDLMGAERDGKGDHPVSELMRPARFVPETKRVPDMLREMQRDKFHMAIVVDEYGGTAGLVTLEDIIEELVGEIADEYDVDTPRVEPLEGGGVRVHGRTPLDEVNEALHARLPEGDWDTIGGLVYDRLGHVPAEGESVVLGRWRLTAQRIQGRRIGRVSITPEAGGGPSSAGVSAPAPRPSASPAPPSSPSSPSGADRGQIGGIEALPFGILIFVVGTLLVVNIAAVINAKLATDSAARQAIRDFVEADVPAAGSTAEAERRAVAAAREALDAEGLDPDKAEVTLLPLDPVGGQEGFSRCARATFEVRYHVPAFTVPWVGGFGDGFDVRSRHSELIDPFRSGVPGSADGCGSV